jgi:hypothetical protein
MSQGAKAFMGRAALFSTEKSWNDFLAKFQSRTDGWTESEGQSESHASIAMIYVARAGCKAPFVSQVGEQPYKPYTGYAVAFLNKTALRACEIVGLKLILHKTENPERPDCAELIVKKPLFFRALAGAE